MIEKKNPFSKYEVAFNTKSSGSTVEEEYTYDNGNNPIAGNIAFYIAGVVDSYAIILSENNAKTKNSLILDYVYNSNNYPISIGGNGDEVTLEYQSCASN
jgi:hypothetical protein